MRLNGTQKIVCELTLRDGKVVYDLNGLTMQRAISSADLQVGVNRRHPMKSNRRKFLTKSTVVAAAVALHFPRPRTRRRRQARNQ